MKIKTSDLIGPALNWAVAKINDRLDDLRIDKVGDLVFKDLGVFSNEEPGSLYSPSDDDGHGGQIIDKAKITTYYDDAYEAWAAVGSVAVNCRDQDGELCTIASWSGDKDIYHGPTRLIAAMRYHCYSELGPEIDIPDELAKSVVDKKTAASKSVNAAAKALVGEEGMQELKAVAGSGPEVDQEHEAE